MDCESTSPNVLENATAHITNWQPRAGATFRVVTCHNLYTSDTDFDTFPWPQSPTLAQVKAVAEAAVSLRALRREIMAANGWSLRDLYRTLETPGTNRLRAAYGMKDTADPLAFLLHLNLALAEKEARGELIDAPGLPASLSKSTDLVTSDCLQHK